MNVDLILQKKYSLQDMTLHALAKICWGDFVLREIIEGDCIDIPRETEKLVAHREAVVSNLPKVLNSNRKLFSTDFPKLLKELLINALICLQQGYFEALIWEEKCQNVLPFTILNPLTACEYQAGCFIDPMGYFNDLAWAKRFVADKNQILNRRYEMACLYCLEETITDLWHVMKTNGQSFADRSEQIKLMKFGNLIRLWDFFMNFSNEFVEDFCEFFFLFNGNYTIGFEEAISNGFEHAARFFWARCSVWQREKFLREPDFDLLSDAADEDHAGLVNFIYSILPLEDKNNLISRSIQNNVYMVWIWSCLLHSPFYEIALKDILNFPFPIPSEIYKGLLNLSAYKIKTLKIPAHKIIFKVLFNHLSKNQQKEVFEQESYIIIHLVELRAMDLLKMVIQPLSLSEKRRMLLYDWQKAGKSALDKFSKADDYDALLHYLLLFFINRNPNTQKLSLRDDAKDFLDQFFNCELIVAWATKEISESEEKEVNKVMESLQVSLQVLHQLLEQVDEMDCVRTSSLIIV